MDQPLTSWNIREKEYLLRVLLQLLGNVFIGLLFLFVAHMGVEISTQVRLQVPGQTMTEYQLLGSHTAAGVDCNLEASSTPSLKSCRDVFVYTIITFIDN